MKIKMMKTDASAKIPTRATEGSAGYDLYALEGAYFAPNGMTKKIRTGIAMEIPEGYVGLVFPRSGLSCKTSLRQPNSVGVIDSDYRGEVHAIMQNISNRELVRIEKGDRIAQIVFVPCADVEFEEVEMLSDTARGTGGFGSTGQK